ncbi:MAG: ATP-dependent helicase [Chlamydiia bacterium]
MNLKPCKLSLSMADLNPEQKKAVAHKEGPLLVLAGAGSGKTRVVIERIIALLNSGVDSSEILAVTFTNKAASEMKERIRSICTRPPLITTFHSFGARFLRESMGYLGFKSNFSIYDTDDSNALLKECFKQVDMKPEKGHLKDMRQAISDAKNGLLLPQDFQMQKGKDPFYQIYSMYQQRLKDCDAIDFDDLLLLPVMLLRDQHQLKEEIQNRYRYILIDEYQDTNQAQYNLTKLLTDKHFNLFVVGDPDQSIYSWRGASIDNILGFEGDFPNAQVIKLEQNYRSTGHILKAANVLISNNRGRFEKNLWSGLGDGEKVQLRPFFDEREESRFIAEEVARSIRHGQDPSTIALLYRTNAQSRSLEDSLLRERIPYTIVGGLSFYERKEIKDLLAYLRLSVFKSDLMAFQRVINTPKRGLGNTAVEKIKEFQLQSGEPIMHLVQNSQNLPLSAKQRQEIDRFQYLMVQIEQASSISEKLQKILKETRYLDYLKEDKETYQDRKENVEALIAKAIEWEEENPDLSLLEFLEELSLRQSFDEAHSNDPKVFLMTLHNSKGLEFHTCFICGVEEDILPHINSKIESSDVEEERRLFYVGMTRAERRLFITYTHYRFLWGVSRPMKKSRFLEELPPSHLEIKKVSRSSSNFC